MYCDVVERERTLPARLAVAALRLNRRLRRHGIGSMSLSQLSALATLYRSGPQTPGELAARDHVRPPSTTKMIYALQELGMVTRLAHPSDRRQAIIELTDAGRARIEQETSARERWLERQLAALSDDERATLSVATEIIDRVAGSVS